jgi:hypothetical protein
VAALDFLRRSIGTGKPSDPQSSQKGQGPVRRRRSDEERIAAPQKRLQLGGSGCSHPLAGYSLRPSCPRSFRGGWRFRTPGCACRLGRLEDTSIQPCIPWDSAAYTSIPLSDEHLRRGGRCNRANHAIGRQEGSRPDGGPASPPGADAARPCPRKKGHFAWYHQARRLQEVAGTAERFPNQWSGAKDGPAHVKKGISPGFTRRNERMPYSHPPSGERFPAW